MLRFTNLFRSSRCVVIGMVHVGALPGTPGYEGSVSKLVESACADAEIYGKCEVDGILLENMHDIPYLQPKQMGPEVTAIMTNICMHVRQSVTSSIPCGIQILAGANREAIAVAQAANLQFIRAEGFVFSHIADEGFTNACAGELLRYRHTIGADDVLIFTDIKKKHSSHSITADVGVEETIKAAEFFLSDGVIVTGATTGDPVQIDELRKAKTVAEGPVIVGSGVTSDNFHHYSVADAAIIGSYFKENGNWKNKVDVGRVKKLMETAKKLQQ